MKLNLGCGDRKLEGYVNVDICGTPDMKCDLSVFPWPFADDSIEEIRSEHFLEHVEDFEATVLEMHRILKPDGVLWFRVPHFRSCFAPWHLHRYQFSTITCNLLCAKLPYQYNGRQLFEKISIRIGFLYMRRIANKFFGCLANLSPIKWDYLGLPIDEIEFKARKLKA